MAQDPTDEPELLLPEFLNLTMIVRNVVVYIAGFVGRKLEKNSDCRLCVWALRHPDPDYCAIRSDYILITEKNNNGLFIPSDDLVKICRITESTIRSMKDANMKTLRGRDVWSRCMREAMSPEIFRELRTDREDDHTPLSNHVFHLTQKIIEAYTKIRLNHVAREATLQLVPHAIRSQMTKLVTFSGN
jgi:hypothetical protein